MNKTAYHSEKGQAMILLVFGVVVLLGFVALAIDGGMVYSDRRNAQNGSDASSLAGGGKAALSLENSYVYYQDWSCSDSRVIQAQEEAKTAAVSRAGDNDYTIDKDVSDKNGVTTWCKVEKLAAWDDKYIDIQTFITADTNTSFAHFVFGGVMRNTVEAITRVRPRTPFTFGHAVVALNKDDCLGNQNGVIFDGSSIIKINGGGVFSNGCLTGDGNKFTVDVTNGTVDYKGDATGNLTHVSPAPDKIPDVLPDYVSKIPVPNCSGLPNRTQDSAEISPGVYNKLSLTSGELTLKPGLYCITGSPNAVKITGGTVKGVGVTIFVTNGGVSVSGNAEVVELSAPERLPNPAPAIPGVLFYLAPGNTSSVELEGNSDSSYVGTIFVPDGDIVLTGGNNTTPTFNTQLVGKNVEIGGNAVLDINFNDKKNFNVPATIELFR
jgi:hypothetical protein